MPPFSPLRGASLELDDLPALLMDGASVEGCSGMNKTRGWPLGSPLASHSFGGGGGGCP